MLWMITRDLINGNEPANDVGRCGDDLATSLEALRVPENQLQQIVEECDFEFRLFDDDGNLYYEGVCKDLDDQDQDNAFEPLDWSQPHVCCTYMEYRKKGETVWKQL